MNTTPTPTPTHTHTHHKSKGNHTMKIELTKTERTEHVLDIEPPTEHSPVHFKKSVTGEGGGRVVEVFAVFIDQPWTRAGVDLTSYQHVGQHGACSPDCLHEYEDATPEEYADLKKELERIGYVLDVRNTNRN